MYRITDEKGSAPRGCGAQMLVSLRGRLQGTVGGGSLEMKAVELAQGLLRADVFSANAPLMYEFLLREHQESTAGMICGGDVQVYFRHLPAHDPAAIALAHRIEALYCAGEQTWLITEVTQGRPGDLAVCYADPAKSAEKLGWKAEKTLVDMCRDSWRWQSQNPMGYSE